MLSALVLAVTPRPASAQPAGVKTNDTYTIELLRRTLQEQKHNPDKVIHTLTNLPPEATRNLATNAPVSPEAAELERQYLAGKISAKQFQKGLEQARQKKTTGVKPAPSAAMSPRAATAAGVTAPAPEPAIPSPPPQPNPDQKKLTDVEQRIDEMMRRNAAREKASAAARAAVTNNPSGAPLTKRQRLDALLHEVVEGRMSDADYKAAREKIAAEPD